MSAQTNRQHDDGSAERSGLITGRALPPFRLAQWVRDAPWAILPSAMDTIWDILALRLNGRRLSEEEIRANIEAAKRPPRMETAPGSIAVLQLLGPISQRADMFTDMSGGTSTERFVKTYHEVMGDPNVVGVLVDMDTPGGSVYGVPEAAEVIYSYRGKKPSIGVANALAASAGYYLGSQFDELWVTPSGEVGSIGIIAAHDDMSELMKSVGVKRTYITEPEGGYKSEGNPAEPLSGDALTFLQGRLRSYYDPFVKAVSRGRKVSQSKVREEFGKGRVFGAEQALAVGMVDRVGTLEEAIEYMSGRQKSGSGKKAEHVITTGWVAADVVVTEEWVKDATAGGDFAEKIVKDRLEEIKAEATDIEAERSASEREEEQKKLLVSLRKAHAMREHNRRVA